MTVLLSVDPGVRGCGVACFVDGVIVACTYVKNPAASGHGPRECAQMAAAVRKWVFGVLEYDPSVIALEVPQIYTRGANRTKGDPNISLLPLAMVDAALAALFPAAEVRDYQPHAWKGSVAKENTDGDNIVEGRVRARLSPAEAAVLDAGLAAARGPRGGEGLGHNVIDGVGVGMFALNRFERRRVFARE